MARIKDKKLGFTIGCDPEFFLRQDGKFVSSIPHVSGTKYEPLLLPLGGNIQRDNVAVEVATDPAGSMEDFVKSISNTLTEAVKILPMDMKIEAIPSADFDPDQLLHPEAMMFGCDPDFDAWEISQNEPPRSAEGMTFRSCGAHIHVGTNGKDGNAFLLDFQGKIDTVRAMDCIHGIISTVLDSSPEALERRKLYGKPGAHRPKDYGVEYRVLSNYWLKSPVTVSLMYHLTKDVLAVVRDNKVEDLVDAIGGAPIIKDTIMNGNVALAEKVIDDILSKYLSDDSKHYYNEALAKVVANDMNFHQEWGLYAAA